MDGSRHPLAVLGLPEGAWLDEVRRAFHAGAKRVHPDAGGTAAAFDELKLAFEAAALVAPRRPETLQSHPTVGSWLGEHYAAVKPVAHSEPVLPAEVRARRTAIRPGTGFAAVLETEMIRARVAA